jgi:hypothetical protein
MNKRSPRKKWRLKLYPSFNYVGASSMKLAYELVNEFRREYALGQTGIHQVDVEMDDGEGWGLWERDTFPPRADAGVSR